MANPMRKKGLQWAHDYAKESAPYLLHVDYHGLSSSQKSVLEDLYRASGYRQSKSSAASGRSRLYSFYLALQKGR